MAKNYLVLSNKPQIVNLEDEEIIFGQIEEYTSRELGAERANVAKVTLFTGADFLHHHKIGEETYICLSGRGRLFLDGEVILFEPGVRVIIKPGTIHAAKCSECCDQLVFLCVSSPAFDPHDVYKDSRGRKW